MPLPSNGAEKLLLKGCAVISMIGAVLLVGCGALVGQLL